MDVLFCFGFEVFEIVDLAVELADVGADEGVAFAHLFGQAALVLRMRGRRGGYSWNREAGGGKVVLVPLDRASRKDL